MCGAALDSSYVWSQGGPGLGEEEEEEEQTHQVILQRVGPDVVFDDLSQLVRSSIGVVGEPGEEALGLLVLPLLARLVWRLARALRQVLGRKHRVEKR